MITMSNLRNSQAIKIESSDTEETEYFDKDESSEDELSFSDEVLQALVKLSIEKELLPRERNGIRKMIRRLERKKNIK